MTSLETKLLVVPGVYFLGNVMEDCEAIFSLFLCLDMLGLIVDERGFFLNRIERSLFIILYKLIMVVLIMEGLNVTPMITSAAEICKQDLPLLSFN